MSGHGAARANNRDSYDLKSLLTHPGRDFLVRNNGEKVKIDKLRGKKLGLYFSGSWCGPCQRFTPELVQVYNELSSKGDFEIILVSADVYPRSFKEYFSKMPWLAVPFTDSEARDRLNELFKVTGIPHLVILDEMGKVLSDEGVTIILEYGAEGFPFTPERIKEIKDQKEATKKDQSLRSVLVSPSCDFVLSNDGKKVPVSELEGKMVGLYFFYPSYDPCLEFTPKLVDVYNKFKEMGKSFEIVMICLGDDDDEEESFKQSFGSMPWFALPFKDKRCNKLVRYFELQTLPTLVVIGPDGKTLHSNAAEAIEEHGIQALISLAPEKFEEVAEIEKAKHEAQTLESILVSGNQDFVIGKDGAKVPVSNLVGKNILLYFSAHWCPARRDFLPKLVEAYQEIKAKNDLFEVIFISSDNDQASFNEYFSGMPWLALPFGDERKESLSRKFEVHGIPKAVAIGPTGSTITTEAVDIIRAHGAKAYPFTAEHLKEIEWSEKTLTSKMEDNEDTEATNGDSYELMSLLTHPERDFLVRNNGEQVPVSQLQGKIVGLYFFSPSSGPCLEFTPKLVEVYGKLKEKGESFEIVMVCLDDDEESFKQSFGSMPWLALPLKDVCCWILILFFELQPLPTLSIIGPDGKTLHSNAVEAIEELGIQAYPFTPEKFAKLEEIEKAKQEAQTLESILVSGNQNFVIGKDGAKVPVSNLVGKNILLYFSAHWCPACRNFLPKLIEAYHKIKAKDDLFEVIFISSDIDQENFDEFFSEMPWLALPFGDVRNTYLSRKFKVYGIPTVVAIGPSGRTVTTKAADLIRAHGADSYPFTEKRLEEIKAEIQEMAKRWPKKVKHALHKEHELVLSEHRAFICNGCGESGHNWSFFCEECDFDLHPKCALEEDKGGKLCKLLKKVLSVMEKIVSKLKNLVFLILKL